MNNKELWLSVEKTAPGATKPVNVGGMSMTSISGQHMIMRATEVFGPVGIGWGWRVIEERFDQGAPVLDKDGKEIGHNIGHTIRIELWYERDGKRGTVEQFGCTPFTYRSKFGVTTDTEAPKKSLTDAIKKALAMLGFSADIFLGLFDDRDYVAERTAEDALEKAENKEAEAERQRQERLDWLKASVHALETATHSHELASLHKKFVRSAQRRGEEKFVLRLAQAHDKRKAELEATPA